MKLSGEHHFASAPAQVYAGLNDPAKVRAAIDVCQRLDVSGPDSYDLQVVVAAFGLRLNQVIHVTMRDRQPPEACAFALTGNSQFGNIQGTVAVRLEPDGAGTRLRYEAEASLTGLIASIAPKLVEVHSQRALAEFCRKLDEQLRQTTSR